jgi:hypothetical protein
MENTNGNNNFIIKSLHTNIKNKLIRSFLLTPLSYQNSILEIQRKGLAGRFKYRSTQPKFMQSNQPFISGGL